MERSPKHKPHGTLGSKGSKVQPGHQQRHRYPKHAQTDRGSRKSDHRLLKPHRECLSISAALERTSPEKHSLSTHVSPSAQDGPWDNRYTGKSTLISQCQKDSVSSHEKTPSAVLIFPTRTSCKGNDRPGHRAPRW